MWRRDRGHNVQKVEPGGNSRCVTGGRGRGGVNAIRWRRIWGFWDLRYRDWIRIRYSQNHWAGLHLTIHFKWKMNQIWVWKYILILYVKCCAGVPQINGDQRVSSLPSVRQDVHRYQRVDEPLPPSECVYVFLYFRMCFFCCVCRYFAYVCLFELTISPNYVI